MDLGEPTLRGSGTSGSQGTNQPAPPGTIELDMKKTNKSTVGMKAGSSTTLQTTPKGVENAKKRLRAFSIQKKTPVANVVPVVKPVSSGNTTVLIGKLTSVKTTPKVEKTEDEMKKPPKPPKPGANKKYLQESYTELQKQTISEIEDMKRKMELVELGIPLGLICPNTYEKALPTKAMPPIKTFLNSEKVDALIRQAKKAKAEGKEFKFDYQKLLPDYDNPFQRKKDDSAQDKKDKTRDTDAGKVDTPETRKSKGERERKTSDRYDRKIDYKREERYRHQSNERSKYRGPSSDEKNVERDDRSYEKYERYSEKDEKYKNTAYHHETKEGDDKRSEYRDFSKKSKMKSSNKEPKETDVNLNDFLVCDSWSLDNSNSSPQVDEKRAKRSVAASQERKSSEPRDSLKEKTIKKIESKTVDNVDMSKEKKIERLKPVTDSIEFEIDPNDEVLDIFDEDSDIEKYSKPTFSKNDSLYDSPMDRKYSKDTSMDGTADDTFLESVINEIKQETMSDNESQDNDKGLVEYDSPMKDSPKKQLSQGSVTPEIDDRIRDLQNQRSDYSDGYRSEEGRKSAESFKSGVSSKSLESGYKSTESLKESRRRCADSLRSSVERALDEALEQSQMSRSTLDSLETWSFVLKICQPLLFRHDKNVCYKQTRTLPKLWYTENPKLCSCVEDRSVVYEELEMCKMPLINQVYGGDGPAETPPSTARCWYSRDDMCLSEKPPVTLTTDWDIEEARAPPQPPHPPPRVGMTPDRVEEGSLDREYQRFMEAVLWNEDAKTKETSRSTTPVRQESRKKKSEGDREVKKSAKKMKLSSEGWSQESEMEASVTAEKTKKSKEKMRKRRRSSTQSSSSASEELDKKKKARKKKSAKKFKIKEAKRRKLAKKLQKQKEKKKKKQRVEESDDDSDVDDEVEKEMKIEKKKLKKKRLQKLKRKAEKKKKARAKSSSSSDSTSSSDSSSESDSEPEKKKRKRRKIKEDESRKKKARRALRQQPPASMEVDVELVLARMKQERASGDEQQFSPRRQRPADPREIINVSELQDDFSNTVHIKQEKECEPPRPVAAPPAPPVASVPPVALVPPAASVPPVALVPLVASVPPAASVPLVASVPPAASVPLVATVPLVASVPPVVSAPPVASAPPVVSVPPVASVPPVPVVQPVPPVPQAAQETPAPVPPLPVEPPQAYGKEEEEESQTSTAVSDIPPPLEDLSQCSSQESNISKERPVYEKDDTHLRPSSQNSNYSFNDVISASQTGLSYKEEEKFENYEQGNYEMYEQLAMAYQSDVASQQHSPRTATHPAGVCVPGAAQRIETVVGGRRGEIKCDWRPSDAPHRHDAARPSRWGLKPGEVNIVLTGGSGSGSAGSPDCGAGAVFAIQTIANRSHSEQILSYDEAYMDMYGASDRLQYGDCFAAPQAPPVPAGPTAGPTGPAAGPARPTGPGTRPVARRPAPTPRASLDARISRVLGEVAKEEEPDKDAPDKGILIAPGAEVGRGKRVSFADGYKPGQDSDVEEPPVKKKKKTRRYGCAWPCPANHPDHVSLWDALPPPPPPPGSPPPPPAPAPPPLHLLRRPQPPHPLGGPPHTMGGPPHPLGVPPHPMGPGGQPHPLGVPPHPMGPGGPPHPMDAPPYPMGPGGPPHSLQMPYAMMQHKFDPNQPMPNFMPPEPPPGMLAFP